MNKIRIDIINSENNLRWQVVNKSMMLVIAKFVYKQDANEFLMMNKGRFLSIEEIKCTKYE